MSYPNAGDEDKVAFDAYSFVQGGCRECGVVLWDKAAHLRWHEKRDEEIAHIAANLFGATADRLAAQGDALARLAADNQRLRYSVGRLTTIIDCCGKGLTNQDDRPGVVLPARECPSCSGTGCKP